MSPTGNRAEAAAGDRAAAGTWLGMASACVSLFAYAAALFVTPSLNNEIARTFGASMGMLGRLPMALMAGFLAGIALTALVVDRLSKVAVMTAGNLAIASGALLFGASGDFSTAMLANLVIGLGGGLSELSAIALVSDLFDDRRRTSMANMSQAMFGVGAVASPLAVGWMLDAAVDWRVGYSVVAAVGAVGAILSLVAVLRGVGRRPAVAVLPTLDAPRSDSWRTPTLAWLCLGIALYVGTEIGQSTWLSVLLERELGAPPALAAAGLSLLWAGLAVGRLVASAVAGHAEDVTILRCVLGLGTLFEAALVLSPGPATALCASFGLGLCFGPVFPTMVSMATSARPDRSGAILAAMIASGAVGGAIVPAAIGIAADGIGLRPALWACVALLVLNAAIFVRMPRPSGAKRHA